MSEETIYDASSDANFEERISVELKRDNSKLIKVGDKEIGKIISYKFKILIRDKEPLIGELTREEMDLIYRLYSSEGANLTQRSTSRYFTTYTFQDFKRILRAFNITKASSPMAPHILEEKSLEDLINLTLQNKENNYLLKLEQDRNKLTEQKLKDLLKDYTELKNNYSKLGNSIKNINIQPIYKPDKPDKPIIKTKDNLILHLADFHIGAKVRKTSFFKNEYNYDVVKSRLTNLLSNIESNKYDTIIINLLGDMIDGMDEKTARRDHNIPQNMDNFEQVTVFLELMEWFVSSLHSMNICNSIKMYSVKNGNHDGITGYVATVALFNKLALLFPNYSYKIFTDFFGLYEFNNHTYIICHGKDDEFMKRGLSLNMGDKEKIMIYEWLDEQNINTSNNIHFIKADLHSDNLNSCYKFDYRNCLSLFGSSDYGSFNFQKNPYGVSYDIISNNQLLRGTFTNL